ncbi:MAG: Gfo/Idh/MocA family oxidoreductase [Cyclobacteriaceae bacterium]|nr:Gfo/Idh/MocA family oxidoreductase [Cyclobacteriaceae bacterium]
MKNSRRDFLKKTGITGAGFVGVSLAACNSQPESSDPFPQTYRQKFNMSGYAAPKLDVVRIGIVGLGNRGTGTVRRLAGIEGVEIRALCDLEPDRVQRSADNIKHLGHKPDFYSGHEDEWKKMVERNDLDLIAIVTPWHLHTPMCVYAMENDKHAYTELPAATTMEECWQLVETSERTRKHCVQMSGSCMGGTAAVILNMAREGFFGELIHGEGCYIHTLLEFYLFDKDMYHNMWRLKANIGKNGNLYPNHGIVPIMQLMDINYGDRMDYCCSISSDDFLMNKTAKRLAEEDDFWNEYVDRDFRGNMNVTTIKTVKGRTIVLNHDVTSPRPRGRRLLSGTKALYHSSPDRISTDQNHTGWGHYEWISDEEFNDLMEKYSPEMNKRFDEMTSQAKQLDKSGHSYYETSPVDWRLIDCLRNGLPVDMDVYQAATSSALTPLSIWSVKNRAFVNVPDFTDGAWQTNQRTLDIQLERGGGNTKLV